MELEEVLQVLLPDIEVLAIIKEIADCQGMRMSLNLALFLTSQRVFNKLIIAAVIVTLLCGDQFKSHNFHMSSVE
jgi:hypothetical protein